MTKELYLLALLIGTALGLPAQICDGNLGENIFAEGDFGSGAANILATDPQIAPGYLYTTIPPPNDGWYLLTNDMTQWANNFNWLEISDNSDDPDGYMMVVNASYTPGLFYEQEVTGLCENTEYVFSADVYNLIPPGSNLIRPNVSFLIDGEEVYSSGDIPENRQWNTYGFTFSTNPGQTTVTLSLRNNAPGGTGNDLALDNITFRPCGPEALILPMTIANICEDGSPIDLEATILGDQYDTTYVQWQQSFNEGLTWSDIEGETGAVYTHTNLSAGFYFYRYLLSNNPQNLQNAKCRVVSNIKVVHVAPKFYDIADTLCAGLSYSFGGADLKETGVYVDSLISSIGCDSIVTLDLTIVPDAGIIADFSYEGPRCSYTTDGYIALDTIRNGAPPYAVFFEGELLPGAASVSDLNSGDYSFRIEDRFGCDLDTTINLISQAPFTLDLGTNQVLELGETMTIRPVTNLPAIAYDWSPPGLIDCTMDCSVVEWTPAQSVSLSLTVTSEQACLATDSIFVEVIKTRNIYIPNAFSPNFDGVNDYFTIYGRASAIQQIDQLAVYDRWGGLVYEGKGLTPGAPLTGWDGSAGGAPLPAGVYTYVARVRFLDEVVVAYIGAVSLVR